MKIKIVGNAVVITSSAKAEELKQLARYAPKSLALYEEENQKFSISLSKASGISAYGVLFAEKDTEGYAQASLLIPEDVSAAKRREWVEDKFGMPLYNLAQVEVQVAGALNEVTTQLAQVAAAIEEV